MKNEKTLRLVTSAMLIAIGAAISFVCEFIPFLNLPFGGTVTLGSLLPLVIISYMYGTLWGISCGFIYSIIELIIGMKTVSAMFLPTSDGYQGIKNAIFILLIDYILAFSVVGVAGIFRNLKSKTISLILGSITGLSLCYFFHIVSGAIFYGAWSEWFFTDTIVKDFSISQMIMSHFTGNKLSWIYSTCYNGCYMIPEILITTFLSIPVGRIRQIQYTA